MFYDFNPKDRDLVKGNLAKVISSFNLDCHCNILALFNSLDYGIWSEMHLHHAKALFQNSHFFNIKTSVANHI